MDDKLKAQFRSEWTAEIPTADPRFVVGVMARIEQRRFRRELATTAVAPAIANALFSATGLRFRRLPLLSEGL